MNTHTHQNNKKRGFIALFFTLGISSMLLAYVAISSESVFDFVHARQRFVESRDSVQYVLECGDAYVDHMVRSLPMLIGPVSTEGCSIEHAYIARESDDLIRFSFDVESIHATGTILRGTISEIESSVKL
jgi:hypothetical protein